MVKNDTHGAYGPEGIKHSHYKFYTQKLRVSYTIRAKNQAINENIDKVMITPVLLICHRLFCVEVRFCLGVVDIEEVLAAHSSVSRPFQ